MFVRLAWLVLVLPGCLGGLTTGAVMPLEGSAASGGGGGGEPMGAELRIFGAAGGFDDNPLMPNAYGLAYRQIGDEHVQTAAQAGWAGAWRAGPGFLFGRLMFDLINSQRTLADDRKFSALSPTLDLGLAPFRNGLCFSASATYDVHFNAPDRMIVGAFVGVCASDRTKR